MTILDAYAVIAFLRAEPAADRVRDLINTSNGSLTAVGLAEVVDHLVRLVGVNEEEALLDLAQLGLLEAVAIDPSLGVAAGRLRAARYHRTRCVVSLADCLAAVTARATSRPLATSDPHLLTVCHLEGIDTVALVDTTGTLWTPPD